MNSALNPDAPEFYPHLKSVTQEGYSKVNKTIRVSNHIPTGASYDLFETYTNFNVIKRQVSKNVITQSNLITVTELPGVKLKCSGIENNSEKIVDANDCMLDQVNINIDTVSGVNKPNDQFLDGVQTTNIASWNRHNQQVIAKIEVGSTTFIGAKNIPRPQLTFKDTIDNSDSLWVPKISDKPNNIKPLSLNIIYNDEGEAIGYEHPYKVELDMYHPPSHFTEPDAEVPQFPPSIEDTKLTLVETEAQLDELINHLNGVTELAVDVEHHSYRTYQGITCLIQITTNEGGDFIIDALAVREHVHKLNLAFTDPKKLKVFHGAEMDVLWLQRDFGVYIVGLFDTYQAAKTLEINGLSLKNLLKKYCGVDIDKKYQLADWRIRPLPAELIQYARMDTHFLLYIWRILKMELLDNHSGQPMGCSSLLMSVFEQSRQVCGQTYKKEVLDDSSHLGLYVRSKKFFNSQQMAALKLLYKWRDAQARELDESTMYLLPNHMLLSLAENLPREVQGVNACCCPMPPFIKQNLITVHRMILSCRELPLEPQLYQMPLSIRKMTNTTHHSLASYNVHDLTHFPDYREDVVNLDQAAAYAEEETKFKPDIEVFVPSYTGCTPELHQSHGIISTLNAEAKLFIPPYDRYRKYRAIAQHEELKEFKDKEAKVAAISKGNELIKREVLVKIQQAKSQVENKDNTPEIVENKESEETTEGQTGEKRKRKISYDKLYRKDTASQITENVEDISESNKNAGRSVCVKPFSYKNVNYRKFFDESNKSTQLPKMKVKKHK